MGYRPEALIACNLQISAVVQGERGALHCSAGPNKFPRAATSTHYPFLPVERQLFILEATGIGKVRRNRVFEPRIRCVTGINGQLNGVEFVQRAKEIAANWRRGSERADVSCSLEAQIIFLSDQELRELTFHGLEKVIKLRQGNFPATVIVKRIGRLQGFVRRAYPFTRAGG